MCRREKVGGENLQSSRPCWVARVARWGEKIIGVLPLLRTSSRGKE